MVKYDVVIIGAGPAGASAAKTLEEIGHSYIIVDKKLFPRNKPCAGVLSPKINSIIEIPNKVRERPLDGYRIFSPAGAMVESSFPESGSIVKRDIFDMFLVKSLKNQPSHATIKEISEEDNHIKVKGDNLSCEANFVVGADGANSIVKKYCGIPSKRIAISAQYIVELSSDVIDKRVGNWFEVYYVLKYGYGWISPMKISLKIGVGIVSEYLNESIWETLDKFMIYPTVKDKSKGGKIIRKESHVIPMSGPLDRLTGNRCILVGDAGGFVYPGTGEGIFYAIKTGQIAAQIIDRAITNNNHSAKYLEKNYLEELEKNGLLGLRDVDFVEKILANSNNAEKYVKKLRHMARAHLSS